MFEREADRIVAALAPEEDWWKSDTPDVLFDIAMMMLVYGIPETAVERALRTLIGQLRGEYGE